MTKWFSCVVTVKGYGSGEVDFSTRMGTLLQGEQDYLAHLAERIATVEADPASFVAITTLGYSDRVDDAGLTPEQRRTKEDDAAYARAVSASSWLRDQLTSHFVGTIFDGLPPEQWRGIAAVKVGGGASNLVNPSPSTEAMRRENRRVEFSIYTFGVPGFAQDQEIMDLG